MSTDLDLASPLLAQLLVTSNPASASGDSWNQLIEGLHARRNLPDDWDGQGALAPVPALVDAAIQLARSLQDRGCVPADFAQVGVNATVIFEWHLPTGYLELEVIDPHIAEGRWFSKGMRRAEEFALSLPCHESPDA